MIELRIEQRVRIVTFIGDIIPDDLRFYMAGFEQHPDYDPTHNSLIDLRHATSLNINSNDVGNVERKARIIFAGTVRRIAFVVSSDVAYGYARAFEIHHSDTADEVKIVSSMREARAWLGLPAGEAF